MGSIYIVSANLIVIMKKKIIGVLGGMGPESTAIFYHELIIQCQK